MVQYIQKEEIPERQNGGLRTMKTRAEQRAEILKGLFNLRGHHFMTAGIRWGWKNSEKEWEHKRYLEGMNTFYPIEKLHEIINRAMEIEPEINERHEDRYKGRKIVWYYIKYTAEQNKVADEIIRRMAQQGYIELRKGKDTIERTNNWGFRILRTK